MIVLSTDQMQHWYFTVTYQRLRYFKVLQSTLLFI